MIEKDFGEPDELTKNILAKLLSVEFPGVNALRHQLEGLKVKQIDEDGSLELKVEQEGNAEVVHTVPVEASYSDIGSSDTHRVKVRILLHVRKGKMCELEFYKDDSSKILTPPDVTKLILDTNGTPWSWTTEK